MLVVLKNKRNWKRVITGDETWLYYNNDGTAEWIFPGEQPSLRANRQVADKKMMFVVFFSTDGIKFADFLPQGETINATYFRGVVDHIAQTTSGPRTQPVWVHMDNAASHRAKSIVQRLRDHSLTRLPHPAYSPDLAPSDFYLFGHLKQALGATRFTSAEELKEAVLSQVQKIRPSEIRRVYNHWVRRLQMCQEEGGDYVHLSG